MTEYNNLEIKVSERAEIPRDNLDLPEATTYDKFRDILKNTVNDAAGKEIKETSEITIVPGKGNEILAPEQRVYAIETKNDNNQTVRLCHIIGEHKMETFLERYSREEIFKYKQQVKIQLDELQDETTITTATKEETGVIGEWITNFEFSEQGIKDFFKYQRIKIKEQEERYKLSLERINKQDKNKLKTSRLEKEMYSILEDAIKENQANIKILEIDLGMKEKEMKKNLSDEPTRRKYMGEVSLKFTEHHTLRTNLDSAIGKVVTSSNTVMPDIDVELPITGSNHAQKVNKIYTRMAIERLITNNLTLNTDLRKVQNQHGINLYEYLKTFLDTGVSAGPFIASDKDKKAFADIKQAHPEVAKYLDKIIGVSRKDESESNKSDKREGKQIYTNPQGLEQYRQRSGGGLFDKLTPGFITDAIDDANIRPEVKNRYKTGAGLLFLVGAGVLARKTVSSGVKALKGEAKGSDYAWLAAGTAIFGGSWINSGNPLDWKRSLKDLGGTVGDIFGSSPDNLESNQPNASIETQTTDGISSMNIIFGGMNAAEIGSMLTTDNNGKTIINYEVAKVIIQSNKNKRANIDQRIQMIETLEKSTNQNIVNMGIQALGITSEKLEQNPEVKYEDLVEKGLTNFVDLVRYMEEKGYTKRNPELQNEIYEYMRGTGGWTTDKLDKIGAFEKEEALTDNTAIKNNIENLTTITDTNKKAELYHQSLKVFKELQNDTNYKGDFEFTEKNDQLYLKTYNKETAIDLQKKQLGPIPLYTTYQTLKAANLTNRLQDIFAGKTEVNKPFNISGPGRDIEFEKNTLTKTDGRKNPRKFVKGKIDTEVVAAGRGGTLNEIAPSLEDHKQAYVDYLNSLPGRKK